MNQRNETIDIAKGIGISLVVLFHCKIGDYSHLHDVVYCVHMPLFFVLAGICFSTRYEFSTFFVKKVLRLLVPMVIFTAIHIVILSCVPSHSLSSVLSRIPQHIPGALWFLNVLFLAEVICFPFVNKVKTKLTNCIAIAIFGIGGAAISSVDLHIPQSLGSVPLACFFVLLGNKIKPYIKRILTNKLSLIIGSVILFIVLVKLTGVNVHLYDGMSEPILVSEILSVIGVIICLSFCTTLDGTRLGGGISVIGQKSLEIMVVHQLFTTPISALFWTDNSSYIYKIAFILMQILITVIGTYICTQFIDKKATWLIGKF